MPADQGPKSWADLLDPKWKGKIAFTDPANSGSAYTTVTMLVDLWGGGEAGWKKVGELFKNLKVLNRSSLVFQGVGNGEYPLGISLEYAGPMWAAGGAPVKVVYPADGTIAAMEGVAIIKGGPNTDSAKAFVDYINRKDVREMILKATFRRPTRSDVDLSRLPGGMPPLSAGEDRQVRRGGLDRASASQDARSEIKDVLQDFALSVAGIVICQASTPDSFGDRVARASTVSILDRRRGRVLHPARAVGLRQDHLAAHDRGLLRARQRRDPLRRASASTGCRRTRATSAWCSRTMRCFPTSRSPATSPTA